MENKKHYVCSECGGVDSKSGVCKTKNCDCQGESLEECGCDDNSHKEVLAVDEDNNDEE